MNDLEKLFTLLGESDKITARIHDLEEEKREHHRVMVELICGMGATHFLKIDWGALRREHRYYKG